MTTSNIVDPQFDAQAAAELREKRKSKIASSLAKRHRTEKAFLVFPRSLRVCSLWFCFSEAFYLKDYLHFGKQACPFLFTLIRHLSK